MVRRHGHRTAMPRLDDFGAPAGGRPRPARGGARGRARRSAPADAIVDYIVDLVRATRERPSIALRRVAARRDDARHRGAGATPALQGRDFVHPRRRQGARGPGAAPPRRARARRRDRGPDHRGGGATRSSTRCRRRGEPCAPRCAASSSFLAGFPVALGAVAVHPPAVDGVARLPRRRVTLLPGSTRCSRCRAASSRSPRGCPSSCSSATTGAAELRSSCRARPARRTASRSRRARRRPRAAAVEAAPCRAPAGPRAAGARRARAPAGAAPPRRCDARRGCAVDRARSG